MKRKFFTIIACVCFAWTLVLQHTAGATLLDLAAIGATATTDNVYAGNGANYAIDGDLSTLWNASSHPPHWLQVDLGGTYQVDGISLFSRDTPEWSGDYYVNYELYGSLNAPIPYTSWGTQLATGTLYDDPVDYIGDPVDYYDVITFNTPVSLRYITVYEPFGTHWAHLAELQVNVDDNSPFPVPEPATMLLFATGLAGIAGLRRRGHGQ